jgi:small subunit ribosomal protein S15
VGYLTGDCPRPVYFPFGLAEATEVKSKVIAEYRRGEKDTGSPEVQIALSTARIRELTEHLKTHAKDHHSTASAELPEGHRRRALSRSGREARDQEIAGTIAGRAPGAHK